MLRLGQTRTLFRIFGFPIKVNPSWVFLFLLIVFSLSSRNGLLHQWLAGEQPSETVYWVLGIIGAVGLFGSLIVHELAHCIIARYTGMPVRGITLFIFGGVSEMGDEPPTAGAEFFMAVIGPLTSVVIGMACLLVWKVGDAFLSWPAVVGVVFRYLGTVNLLLAVFNSMPAFPLDGGRVVRSILWGVTGSLRTATSIAAGLGSAFALLMTVGGVLMVFLGSVIGGIWFIFIGFFLRQAAATSVEQVRMRHTLSGEVIGRFMTTSVVTVRPELTLRQFVDEYVLPYHFAVFPVVDGDGRLIGLVRARDPAAIAEAEWGAATVALVMREATPDVLVDANTEAVEALSRLRGEAGRRLIVVENGRPVGIVSLRDLLDFLALKIDLSPRGTSRG